MSEISALSDDDRFTRISHLLQQSKVYSSVLQDRLQKEREAREKARLEEEKLQENKKDRKSRREARERDKAKNLEKVADRKAQRGKTRSTRRKNALSKAEVQQLNKTKSKNYAKKIGQPRIISGANMYDYQIHGIEWMASLYENGLNGILADEMGLGKTLQTIAFLAYLIERQVGGPYLVVVPLSTLNNWENEFRKFAPSIPIVKFHGDNDERARLWKGVRIEYELQGLRKSPNKEDGYVETFPVVLATYETVVRDSRRLQRLEWKYLVVDEGHRIKNMNSILIKKLKLLDTSNRLLLTGTPLQNNLTELWSLLNFLLPDVFSDLSMFQSWFDENNEYDKGRLGFGSENRNAELVETLHSILKPFLLRRLKSEVHSDLPDKREYHIYIRMVPLQEALEHRLRNHARAINSKSKRKPEIIPQPLGKRVRKKVLREDIVDTFNADLGSDDDGVSDLSVSENDSKRQRTRGSQAVSSEEDYSDSSSEDEDDEEDETNGAMPLKLPVYVRNKKSTPLTQIQKDIIYGKAEWAVKKWVFELEGGPLMAPTLAPSPVQPNQKPKRNTEHWEVTTNVYSPTAGQPPVDSHVMVSQMSPHSMTSPAPASFGPQVPYTMGPMHSQNSGPHTSGPQDPVAMGVHAMSPHTSAPQSPYPMGSHTIGQNPYAMASPTMSAHVGPQMSAHTMSPHLMTPQMGLVPSVSVGPLMSPPIGPPVPGSHTPHLAPQTPPFAGFTAMNPANDEDNTSVFPHFVRARDPSRSSTKQRNSPWDNCSPSPHSEGGTVKDANLKWVSINPKRENKAFEDNQEKEGEIQVKVKLEEKEQKQYQPYEFPTAYITTSSSPYPFMSKRIRRVIPTATQRSQFAILNLPNNHPPAHFYLSPDNYWYPLFLHPDFPSPEPNEYLDEITNAKAQQKADSKANGMAKGSVKGKEVLVEKKSLDQSTKNRLLEPTIKLLLAYVLGSDYEAAEAPPLDQVTIPSVDITSESLCRGTPSAILGKVVTTLATATIPLATRKAVLYELVAKARVSAASMAKGKDEARDRLNQEITALRTEILRLISELDQNNAVTNSFEATVYYEIKSLTKAEPEVKSEGKREAKSQGKSLAKTQTPRARTRSRAKLQEESPSEVETPAKPQGMLKPEPVADVTPEKDEEAVVISDDSSDEFASANEDLPEAMAPAAGKVVHVKQTSDNRHVEVVEEVVQHSTTSTHSDSQSVILSDSSFSRDESPDSNLSPNIREFLSSIAFHKISTTKTLFNLRKVANSPYLVQFPWMGEEPVDERIISDSGKMRVFDQLSLELLDRGHKILVFSQFATTLEFLTEWCEFRNLAYCILMGNMSIAERQQMIDEFQTRNGPSIFLITTRAGGTGINLTAADSVIIFDSDWNPQQDKQAIDRSHRIGQKNPCVVYRLISTDTIEEMLVRVATEKKRLDEMVIQSGDYSGFAGGDRTPTDIDKTFLREIMTGKSDYEAHEGIEEIDSELMDILLDRSEESYQAHRDKTVELPKSIEVIIQDKSDNKIEQIENN